MRQTRDQQRFNAFVANFMSSPDEELSHPSENDPIPNLDGYNSQTGQASYVSAPSDNKSGNITSTNTQTQTSPTQNTGK